MRCPAGNSPEKDPIALNPREKTGVFSYMIYEQASALRRPSLRDQIREILLERIGDGTLSAGDRIIEAALAKEFGVSAIPVREALRELVAMGVLEFAPHKGAWVREVSLAETIEALEIKATLEALAGRLAAPLLRGKCAVLRKECHAILKASRKRDFVAYQYHNQVFHRLIVEGSGNRTLLRTWNSLAFEVRTRPILQFLENEDPVAMAREHEAVLNALDAGNARKASTLLARHSNSLVEHLRRELAKEPNPSGHPQRTISKRTKSRSRT